MADEVRFDIVATDKASKILDQVADKAVKVEKLDPTVDVKANTHDADHSIDGLDDQLAKLTAKDQVVVLALRAGAAQNELTDLATKLATIDKADPALDVTFDRYQQVSGQLDDLKKKIVDIGDTPIDPGGGDGGKNLDNAKNKLHELGDEADRTKDTVHSMAGNAIGDFAQTATGIGPLGEALGQLTELASGGESSFKQLAAAGLGLGAISAGIAVLNIVMGHFAEAAKRAAEIKAFNDKQVKDYTDSILAAITALDKLNGVDIGDPIPSGVNKNMQDLSANTIELIDAWQKAGKIEAFDPVAGKITDMTHALAAAGITAVRPVGTGGDQRRGGDQRARRHRQRRRRVGRQGPRNHADRRRRIEEVRHRARRRRRPHEGVRAGGRRRHPDHRRAHRRARRRTTAH